MHTLFGMHPGLALTRSNLGNLRQQGFIDWWGDPSHTTCLTTGPLPRVLCSSQILLSVSREMSVPGWMISLPSTTRGVEIRTPVLEQAHSLASNLGSIQGVVRVETASIRLEARIYPDPHQ